MAFVLDAEDDEEEEDEEERNSTESVRRDMSDRLLMNLPENYEIRNPY